MKKALIIGGSIVGGLLVLLLAAFIFFPGIPTYIDVKMHNPSVDEVIEDFEIVDVPDDFETYSAKGVSFKMPKGAEKSVTGSSVKLGKELSVLVMEEDSHEMAALLAGYAEDPDIDIDYDPDPWSSYLYEEDDYRHFFKSMDTEFPTDYNARSDVLWFTKGGFTAKDCLKLRGRDREIFKEFADNKEESVSFEKTYKTEGDGFSGYACCMNKKIDLETGDFKDVEGSHQWTCHIYPDGSTTKYYFIMISGTNEDIKPQVISSIKLEK